MFGPVRRLSTVLACVLAVLLLGAAPLHAQSDGNGIEEITVNTFRVDPEAGFVRVEVQISLRNVTTDVRDGNVIRQRYLNGYGIVIPAGAENPVAVSSGGTVLAGEVVTEGPDDPFAVFTFDLPRRLYSGDSTTITVTYDHRGLPPRSEIPWRSNAAYSSFIAFGIGDTGSVAIELVLPAGYTVDDFSDIEAFEEQPPDALGTVTWTASGLDDQFGALISVSNDDRLVQTPVTVDGAPFVIKSWPGDDEWVAFTEGRLEAGVPGLEDLIGSEWPIEEELTIRETVEPVFAGYSGWFDTLTSEIAVGEEHDALTTYHELSHAWFNGRLLGELWLMEGFAQVYAAEMLRRDGEEPPEPARIVATDPDRVELAAWTVDDERAVEEFGYDASWHVLDEIVDEIGFEAMAEVLDAATSGAVLYGEPGEATTPLPLDWKRAYDLFEIVGGATVVDELYRDHVLRASDIEQLDERATTRSVYDTSPTRRRRGRCRSASAGT